MATTTLKDLYTEQYGDPGIDTDTITTGGGRSRATPFSKDDSLEIDDSVVTTDWLNTMRGNRGGTLNTLEYSTTVNRNWPNQIP